MISLPSPSYDRDALRAGIVHLGLGGFHRAHMARYTHDLLQQGDAEGTWGIAGIGMLETDAPLCDALTQQDCLYTLVEQGAAAEHAEVIGSIVRAIALTPDATAVLSAIDDACIVSLTVTSNGYCLNTATNELDFHHPGIVRDLATPENPHTAIGLIVEGLRRRRASKRPAFTALSCDNIQHNGDVLRAAVLAFARARDADLAAWVESEARFPNTMVDRITPVPSSREIEAFAAKYGAADARPVFCEPFRQWIIEDDFTDGRPPWENVGVQFVDDVTPYEFMKLRLLNASHLAIAGLGRLIGYRFVDQTMADPLIAAYMAALMDRETGPTLLPVPGIDLEAYKATLIDRFANPKIKDTLDRINNDASVNYLLDPLRDRLAHQQSVEHLTLALAAWIRRFGGLDEKSDAIEVRHPLAEELRRKLQQGGSDARPVLSIAPLFGDLGSNAALVEPTSRWLRRLNDEGAHAALTSLLRLPDQSP